MNAFSGIESGQGILKNAYEGDSAMSQALERKRKKMAEKRGMGEDPDKAPEDKDISNE